MTVEVLLSSYNGEKFIKEQIESILSQDIPVHLTVRDDGSCDSTVEIVSEYKQVTLIKGNNIGATNSFLYLIENAEQADYYAFSDQDDVWDDDKIRIAIESLNKYNNTPALYSSNTRLVDSNLKLIRKENKKPQISLGSAIAKNYATGCTVVFNHSLMNLLKQYKPQKIPFHDWWVNMVCISVGGVSIFDNGCHMSYRQHGANVVGGAVDFISKWKSRVRKFLFYPYNRQSIAKQLLDNYQVTPESLEILKDCSRGDILFDKRFKTGKLFDDLLFNICVLLRKI